MLRWFLIGLILGGPIVIGSGGLSTLPNLAPSTVSAAVLILLILSISLLAVLTRWPRSTKEALISGLAGTIVSSFFIWGLLFSHPR